MLQESHSLSFAQLTADAPSQMVVVARFLALLEMYREKVIVFTQNAPLDTLQVTWSESAVPWDVQHLEEEYGAPETGVDPQPAREELIDR